MSMHRALLGAALIVGLGPLSVAAGDGVIEINQACAAAGCTPGDAPGFPVSLTASGSYRLTSNLEVPDQNTTAIELGSDADRSSIDLNGFAILGPTVCSSIGACSLLGSGNGIAASAGTTDVTVRNGRILGMGDHGVLLQNRDYVQGVTAQSNGGVGIEVGPFSSVIDCQAISNGGVGIRVDENTSGTAFDNAGESLIHGNLSVRNGRAGAGGDFQGGTDTGGNVCSDGTCSDGGHRRYYLTLEVVGGGAAGAACDAGFRVASVWELFNPGALRYDRSRGFSTDQSGTGPPVGWNGWAFVDSGMGDCSEWSDPAGNGGLIRLEDNPLLQTVGPWLTIFDSCASTGARVWCIEE